jgi:hypothetical protein
MYQRDESVSVRLVGKIPRGWPKAVTDHSFTIPASLLQSSDATEAPAPLGEVRVKVADHTHYFIPPEDMIFPRTTQQYSVHWKAPVFVVVRDEGDHYVLEDRERYDHVWVGKQFRLPKAKGDYIPPPPPVSPNEELQDDHSVSTSDISYLAHRLNRIEAFLQSIR